MITHYPPQEAVDLFVKRTNHHIELVKNNIYLFQENEEYNDIFDELTLRANNHDRSKFSEPELTPYIWLTWSYHCKKNNIPFKFPIGMDQKIRDAKFHHVANNRHHPEWHLDLNDMTTVDLIEMVCDWKAAGQEFGEKSLVDFAERALGKRFLFNENKIKLIWELVHKIEDEKSRERLEEITPSNEELLKMAEKQSSENDHKKRGNLDKLIDCGFHEMRSEAMSRADKIIRDMGEHIYDEAFYLAHKKGRNRVEIEDVEAAAKCFINYPKPEIMVSEKLTKEEFESFEEVKEKYSLSNNPHGYPFKYTFASEYFDFIIVTDGYSDERHPMTGKEFDLVFKVGKKDGVTQPAVTREELKNLADFIYKVLNAEKFVNFKKRLSSVIKEEHIEDWLQTANKAFKGRKPIDLVNEGNFDPLFEMLYRLESGTPM